MIVKNKRRRTGSPLCAGIRSDRRCPSRGCWVGKPFLLNEYRIEGEAAVPREVEVPGLVRLADFGGGWRDVGRDEDRIGAMILSREFGQTQAGFPRNFRLAAGLSFANQASLERL